MDIVFAPAVDEVYPGGEPQVTIEPGPLATVLEGATRPGHFRGVLTVVAKLFGLVRPDVAVFGQKDYQQLALIRRMVLDLNLGVEVVGAETRREVDGLALSSRNRYLDDEQRQEAVVLSRTLQAAREVAEYGAAVALGAARAELRTSKVVNLDYLVITATDLSDLPDEVPARHRGPDPHRRAGRGHPADRQPAAHPGVLTRRPPPPRRPPRTETADAAHHDEEQDPPGHRDPGGPALRGSVTVDEDLLDAADLLAGELVHIVDVTNGARLETYTIAGERGSGVLGINGAAARLVHPGDVVILIGYGQMETAEAREFAPHVVFVDADNKILATGFDPAEAFPGSGLVRGDRVEREVSA